MAATTRQTNLLVQQDWKKVYQSFQNADFQSYDFETLRKSMIDYLRAYYPEDFNDFIESSEYVALIDLIAFMGQSLAFRTDLNARENFMDTAERRDSVLRLARLISYVPKRNVSASGLLRVESVSTTETVLDSNDINLANIPINWNDPGNENWLEQLTLILNTALVDNQLIGVPGNTALIGGVTTDEYSINILNTVLPTYSFNSVVENIQMAFEAVSATSLDQEYIYEREPRPQSVFNLLFRNDALGNDSTNTGYFLFFKQGQLKNIDFTLDQKLPNRVVNVQADNINDADCWLYQIDAAGNYVELWSKVDNVNGTNIAYNTATQRNIYQISTRAGDQIDLVFGDGAFANIPGGSFRFFYRVANGLNYKISPIELQNIVVPVGYVSRSGRTETLTIRASLYNTVNNASARETLQEIKTKAPQQYYTQNRMITGEDYNTLPFTRYNSILKIKSTNRSNSGVSRYLDTIDITGKYSSTNIFASDGILYAEETIRSQVFVLNTTASAQNQLAIALNNRLLQDNYIPFSHFIYANLPRYNTIDLAVNASVFDASWQQMTLSTGQCTGFISLHSSYLDSIDATGVQSRLALPALKVGPASSSALKYIKVGSIIKFRAGIQPQTGYFTAAGQSNAGNPNSAGETQFIYATVVNVTNDGVGAGVLTTSDPGPITLSSFVPTGAVIEEIIPKITTVVPTNVLRAAANFLASRKNFGLRFSQSSQQWQLIQPQDLKLTQINSVLTNTDGFNATYNESSGGDTSASSADSSWLIAFVSGTVGYTIYYRQLDYVFQSAQETKFYFDPSVRVYDSKSATVLSDQIKVLRSNSVPDGNTALFEDKAWFVHKMIIDADGRENTNKLLVKFSDSNRDGVPDNPDIFNELVNPSLNTNFDKYVYFTRTYGLNGGFVDFLPIQTALINAEYESEGEIVQAYNLYENGQIFFATGENRFYDLQVQVENNVEIRTLTGSDNNDKYVWRLGRNQLFFQYRHVSPSNRRIDPSPNNIVDLYILTKTYADDYQSYLRDTTGQIQLPENIDVEQLRLSYGELENFKTISDTIIYNSGRFKPIIGSKSNEQLRATFKIIKNREVVISDNDVKVALISAVNTYFDISNWDFGETFYFSELSAYLHTALSSKISSVVIVPKSTQLQFGSLFQINAEPDEIITSSATVDDVEIITTITAAIL